MGKLLIDQYSLLHFAFGIIAYFFDVSLKNWFIFHTLFELLENSRTGIYIINQYFIFWPGGKPYPDTFINNIGDTIFTLLGWLSAYYLDKLGNKYGWYKSHIN
jgi:hypothetical protein